jgi:uncharacterized protein
MTEIRVVIDTNVVISATLAEHSTARKAIFKAIDTCQILISQEVLTEFGQAIVRTKFNKYIRREDRLAFLNALVKESGIIAPTSHITDCRDQRDNKFLELAVDGNAQYIITGDNDLLQLSPYRGIHILTPADFLEKINSLAD